MFRRAAGHDRIAGPRKPTTTTFTTTTTETTTTVTTTVSGSSPPPLAKRTFTAAGGGVTGTGLDGTVTVRPTATPDYAGAYGCDSYEEYYSACVDGLGVSARTTTAPAETKTATSTVIITCVGSYIFTKYLGMPFPTALIPPGISVPQPTTIIVGETPSRPALWGWEAGLSRPRLCHERSQLAFEMVVFYRSN
ncbi:hypothetical protein PG988_007378 [Apiospora saccharicola]